MLLPVPVFVMLITGDGRKEFADADDRRIDRDRKAVTRLRRTCNQRAD